MDLLETFTNVYFAITIIHMAQVKSVYLHSPATSLGTPVQLPVNTDSYLANHIAANQYI